MIGNFPEVLSFNWLFLKPNRITCDEGVVYTMDHEVIPWRCKIRHWLLNSSHNHFGLHQQKIVRVAMKFEVPKRHILRSTLSYCGYRSSRTYI